MTRPLKPPRGLFISTSLIFHPAIQPPVKDTLVQFMALAWGDPNHMTPPVSLTQLSQMTGKTTSTLYGHIAVLRNIHSVLRLQSAGNRTIRMTLAGWLFADTSPPNSEMPESPDQDEENQPVSSIFDFAPPPDDNPAGKTQFAKRKPLRARRSAPASPPVAPAAMPELPAPRQLPDDLRQALLQAGIFPSLLEEIAASQRSEQELSALLAWARHDRPENPAPVFMGRLRHEARPPERFFASACPRCGQHGGHSAECPHRYVL